MTIEHNKHPFKEFITEDSTKLIIGTIPPSRFCYSKNDIENGKRFEADVEFYYGSADNKFWALISEVTGNKFEGTERGVDQRKEYLIRNKFGITDIIEECERKNKSAADSALTITKFRDIKSTLKEYQNINTLIYTSNKVKSLMCEHLNTFHSSVPGKKNNKTIKINGKEYNVIILYSPSPSGLRRLKGGNDTRKKQYSEVF